MEAANKGAAEAGGVSSRVGHRIAVRVRARPVREPGDQLQLLLRPQDDVRQDNYAQGFVVLPGGFGTLDELFEALTLVQTRKVTSFPVVLFDSTYWSGLIGWLRETALARGSIAEADFGMFTVTDDPDEAVARMLSNQPMPGPARHPNDHARLPGRESIGRWSGSSPSLRSPHSVSQRWRLPGVWGR